MRKLDSLVPEALADDVFGQHAAAAMRKIHTDGYQAWLEAEVLNPSWTDPDWCRMIVALVGGQAPNFPEDETITFHCPRCKDTGFIHLKPIHRFGNEYQVSDLCDPCPWRLWAKAQWLKKAEREGTTRRGRLSKILTVMFL